MRASLQQGLANAQPRPGIVVGLKAEATLTRPWNLPTAIGGGSQEGAAKAAESLAPTVTALISFGLAGALDPTLRPGDLLIPTQVIDGKDSWPTDPTLSRALGGPTPHTILGGGEILATPAAKQAAHATGAHAVDLESAAVARAAARHNLPFAVLRAICDPAHRTLPQAALVALDPTGRLTPLRIAYAILTHPHQLPSLLALAHDAATARQALLTRVSKVSLPLPSGRGPG